jgi:hypothetical protein
VALIDLGAIFGSGDENEADENEPDEGGPAHRPQPRARAGHGPLPMVLVGVALGALAAAAGVVIGNRVRRLRARLRTWSAARR